MVQDERTSHQQRVRSHSEECGRQGHNTASAGVGKKKKEKISKKRKKKRKRAKGKCGKERERGRNVERKEKLDANAKGD